MPAIEYFHDASVDAILDQHIRTLLSTCFTKPQDVVFQERRYFKEPYPNRWLIRDADGIPVAHVGVHEKHVEADGRRFPIGGIAEVCVHPDHRGRGYVRAMLAQVHPWLIERGFIFSVLFGDSRVYGSSGYVSVDNLLQDDEQTGEQKRVTAMVRPLSETPWPASDVYLPGPNF